MPQRRHLDVKNDPSISLLEALGYRAQAGEGVAILKLYLGQTSTHTNVVLGDVGSKPELHNSKHVLSRKHRDLLRLKHGGDLQFSESFASQFDEMPTRRWRVLKVVVHSVDHTQVRLEQFCRLQHMMYSTFLTASPGLVLFTRSNLLKRKDLCFSCLRLGLIRHRRS